MEKSADGRPSGMRMPSGETVAGARLALILDDRAKFRSAPTRGIAAELPHGARPWNGNRADFNAE